LLILQLEKRPTSKGRGEEAMIGRERQGQESGERWEARKRVGEERGEDPFVYL